MNLNQEQKILKFRVYLMLMVFDRIYCKLEYNKKQQGLFYILIWTDRDYVPFSHWHLQQKSFTTMGCQYQNCYIVDDSSFFKDVTDFDAILYNAIDLTVETKLPIARTDNQMYIFVSTESSQNYPTNDKFNWFFNYTWTYKMDSDIYYPYFIIRNIKGEVVGPKVDVKWMDINDMEPTSDFIRAKLETKKVAVTWFVTNCRPNKRIHYMRSLREALQKYQLDIDVYGFCDANKRCLKDHMDDCLSLIESDYYFYLSFENSFDEDYVTEKLMNALDHYAVPVVMGGANYSRYMPDGIYLNANNLTGEQLAAEINEAIKNREKYFDYFKWHNHYSYHMISDSADTDPLCTFCAFLNDESNRERKQVYARFVKWWNGFDTTFNATGDIIVHFNKSRKVYKTIYNETKTKPPILFTQVATTSMVQSVGDFVGNLFNFYFD